MPHRFIVPGLLGFVALAAAFLQLGGRVAAPPLPALALSQVQEPGAPEPARARHRIIIEPLPVPTVPVSLHNVNTDETATFHVGKYGEVTAEERRALDTFFRCRRTGRMKPMSAGVLALLADVASRWPGRTIEVISGFRAPPYGAPHSKHFRGQAIDLRVRGVRTAALRDHLWRNHHQVGVGHYPSTNFVHMDWRPGEPDTAWTGADEEGTPEYHPRWARRARQVRKAGPRRAQASLAAGPAVPGTL
jgi:uncharacterized protein YcbK (DUF882 family)